MANAVGATNEFNWIEHDEFYAVVSNPEEKKVNDVAIPNLNKNSIPMDFDREKKYTQTTDEETEDNEEHLKLIRISRELVTQVKDEFENESPDETGTKPKVSKPRKRKRSAKASESNKKSKVSLEDYLKAEVANGHTPWWKPLNDVSNEINMNAAWVGREYKRLTGGNWAASCSEQFLSIFPSGSSNIRRIKELYDAEVIAKLSTS